MNLTPLEGRTLVAALRAELDPQSLHIHKEDPKTTHTYCPGKNIVKADFIHWVTDRMQQNHGAADSGDSKSDNGQTDGG